MISDQESLDRMKLIILEQRGLLYLADRLAEAVSNSIGSEGDHFYAEVKAYQAARSGQARKAE